MSVNKKYDNLWVGLIPGIILPLVTIFIIGMVRFQGSFSDFLSSFQAMGILSKVISLSAIPNLLLFFIFIWTNRNFSARGVIFATLVIAGIMLILKFA